MNEHDTKTGRFAIITPSFRNDFDIARELSRSIDAFVAAEVEHILVVPQRDVELFATLASSRRRVVSKQTLLGAEGFHALPVPGRIHVPFVMDRNLREQWWKARVGRISGWVAQQLVKLSADALSQAETLIFADSDALLVRRLDCARFKVGRKVRLHRVPMHPDLKEHIAWTRVAREILGLPTDAPVRHEYIGQLISWRRDTLIQMHRHIERMHGRPWQDVVARHRSVAEYMLYGVYCDEVLGLPDSGHEAWRNDLTHSLWIQEDQSMEDFTQGLAPHHVAIHLQSTLGLKPSQREACVRAAVGAGT